MLQFHLKIMLPALFTTLLLASCAKQQPQPKPTTEASAEQTAPTQAVTKPEATATTPATTPSPTSDQITAQTPQEVDPNHEAIVLKALPALGPNTVYLQLEANNRQFWVATANIDAKIGDTVRYSTKEAIKQKNFHSKTLDRTFDEILFIPDIAIVKTK